MFRICRLSRSPFTDIQSSLVRSFRLEQLLSQVDKKDLVLAKQENDKIFSFVGFQGVAHDDVASRLLQVPSEMRYFHVVSGRDQVPCDFFGDLDLEGPLTPKEAENLVLQAVQQVHKVYLELYQSRFTNKKRNLGKVDQESSAKKLALDTVILQNPASTTKRSFHLHVHSPIVVLSDFRMSEAIADSVNATLAKPVFDLQCYRGSGMLRLAYNGKPNTVGAELVPYTPRSDVFQALLGPKYDKKKPEEFLQRSMVLRPDALVSKKGLYLFRSLPSATSSTSSSTPRDGTTTSAALKSSGRGRSTVVELDKNGNPIHPFLKEANKKRRYIEARKYVRQLPPRASDNYDTWVRVGLALHNFGCEEALLDEWVLFSLRSPQKYSREACAKKWERFGRSEDESTNWRRGYNYLTKTLWRELGLPPGGGSR